MLHDHLFAPSRSNRSDHPENDGNHIRTDGLVNPQEDTPSELQDVSRACPCYLIRRNYAFQKLLVPSLPSRMT